MDSPRHGEEGGELLELPSNATLSALEIDEDESASRGGMTRYQAYNLYTSHILSTWNARQYEFAAVILQDHVTYQEIF